MFSVPQNLKTAEIIWERYEENKTVEISVVTDLVGNEDYIFKLVQRTDIANLSALEELIVDRYIKREILKASQQVIDQIKKGSELKDTIGNFETQKALLLSINETGEEQRIDQIKKVLDQIQSASSNPNEVIGVDTGYDVLNRMTGGWQKTDQIIVAGRPGMGKTTIVLCYFLLAASLGAKVVLFSLEMSRSQIYQKFISMLTGIDLEKIRKGVSPEEMELVNKASEWLYEQPIWIETAFNDLESIKNRMRYLNDVYDIDLMAVDYVQLLSIKGAKGKSKNDLLEEISREFKILAKEDDCHCTNFIISQLNRGVEIRGGAKRPLISDLRGSGGLEQDADSIQLIYRPDYYEIIEDEQGRALKNIVEINFAKHRNGKTGTVHMKVDLAKSHFLEIDKDWMIKSNPFLNILFPNQELSDHDQMKLARENNEEVLPF